jgi:hypothetical protein
VHIRWIFRQDYRHPGQDRREILKAVLRLARTRPPQDQDPLIQEAIALALSGGAVLGVAAATSRVNGCLPGRLCVMRTMTTRR